MECFTLLLFLATVGLAVWLAGLSSRTRAQGSRLDALESENRWLRRRLEELAATAAPAATAEAAPAPSPEAEPVGLPAMPRAAAAAVPEAPPAAEVSAVPQRQETKTLPPPPRLGEATRTLQRIDWERWVGVRGAAVLGAAVLGLAGILFLKFSIEQGLIPPPVRVALGILAGLASIGSSEFLRRGARRYEATANALAGAGVVLLYAALWAAHTLYALIGAGPAFVLMALVTTICGALSWRQGSRVIAVLGLVGGFATPVLLAAEVDRPIGLFSYLLLLDAGLLVLATRRGWPLLGVLSLAITALYEASFVFGRMGPDRSLLGLGILAVFAVLYGAAGPPAGESGGRSAWWLARAGGVLLPFAFALYFASRAELAPHLYPVAAFLTMLSVLALAVGRRLAMPHLAFAAAAADLAVVLVWCLRSRPEGILAWEAVGAGILLTLAFQLFVEFATPPPTGAAPLAASGFHLLFTVVPLLASAPSPWPWFAGWVVLAAVLWRQSGRFPAAWLELVAAFGLGFGPGFFLLAHGHVVPLLIISLIAAAGLQVLALARDRRGGASVEQAGWAATVMPLLALALLWGSATDPAIGTWLYLSATLGLGVLALMAATRLGAGGAVFAAMAFVALAHGLRSLARGDPSGAALLGLGIETLAVVLFTAWPFIAGRRLIDERWAWRAAALAGPAWFLSLKQLFERSFGDAWIGLVAVALGGLALAAALRVRRLGERAGDAGGVRADSRVVAFAAVALGFAAVAVPLQFDREWLTIGWALQGLAVLWLWKFLDHPGLKYQGLALLAAATLRLVANPAVPGYYPRSGVPVVNWLLYTYFVPAAALLGAALILAALEVSRRRSWEKALYPSSRPLLATLCGLAAVVVIFVWINLAIFDLFSQGPRLVISFARLPARDLALSLAWLVYALGLLVLGLAKDSRVLRWASLAVLVVAIGKVFLYDLGELRDLYRVASLVGLAVSLIVVSLAYQRFVFGRASGTKRGNEADADP